MSNSSSNIFGSKFLVRSYETNADGVSSLYTINNYLQEIAGYHAQQLDFDIQDLLEHKQTWVLQRLVIAMEKYPQWRNQIEVQTWPSGSDGLRAYRDFKILDGQNHVLGTALSYWMIIDISSRRPMRLPDTLISHPAIHENHVMEVARERIKISLDHCSEIDRYTVQPSDIDVNKHLNTAVYTRVIENALFKEWGYRSGDLNSLDIAYHREMHQGDEMIINAYQNDQYVHVAISTNRNTVAAQAIIEIN
jgi:acyl-ACP thioesterase